MCVCVCVWLYEVGVDLVKTSEMVGGCDCSWWLYFFLLFCICDFLFSSCFLFIHFSFDLLIISLPNRITYLLSSFKNFQRELALVIDNV